MRLWLLAGSRGRKKKEAAHTRFAHSARRELNGKSAAARRVLTGAGSDRIAAGVQ